MATTLREYLFALGWKVDEGSQRKMVDALETTTKRAAGLGVAIEGAAAAVFGAVTKMSRSLESLYWSSKRTGSSVKEIDAFSFAVEQMGGSATEARGALEGLAMKMRTNPAMGQFLRGLGVDPTHGPVQIIEQLDQVFDRMRKAGQEFATYQIGNVLGISPDLILTMSRGIQEQKRLALEFQQTFGVNMDESADKATKFDQKLRLLQKALYYGFVNVGTKLLDVFGPKLEQGLKWLLDPGNAKVFVDYLEKAGHAIVRVAEAINDFVIGAASKFKDLNDATGGWALTILGVTAALRYLGLLGAVLNPLTLAIAAVGAAIFALSTDYDNWKQGGGKAGSSFIDWAKWDEDIKNTKQSVDTLRGWLSDFFTWLDSSGAGKSIADQLTSPLHILAAQFNELIDLLSGRFPQAWEQFKKSIGFVGKLFGIGPVPDDDLFSEKNPDSVQRRLARKNPNQYFGAAERANKLPSGLLGALWGAESSQGRQLRSPAGAEGDFQFMPNTAKEYGLDDPYDLAASSQAAARKMRHLLDRYSGSLDKAIAAYNWGEGNLDKYGMSGAPGETRREISTVLSGMGNTRLMSGDAARSSDAVTLNQHTEINVHAQGGHAADIADHVRGIQGGVNADMASRFNSPNR